MYRFYNANSHGNRINDCTIRAISLATGKSWNETYKELANAARKKGLMMDSIEFINGYLDSKYKRVCHNSITLDEFINEYPYGTYIISMPGHLTCVIDGVCYDTFNPKDRIIWCSWYVPKKD